jgi:hypothetical protein
MPRHQRALRRNPENAVAARQAAREPALRASGRAGSWKVEITAGTSGRWSGNSVRFATRDEAKAYGRDLATRWLVPEDWRVSESADPVNYQLAYDGGLIPI